MFWMGFVCGAGAVITALVVGLMVFADVDAIKRDDND